MTDITNLAIRLKEMGFNLLISRYVVTKRRPRNFFQNSQSAEKGFEENVEDTMFIAYPISFQGRMTYDPTRYFIVGTNEGLNTSKMFENTIWAFEGASLGFSRNVEMGWEGIDICNYHEYLLSDHIPIYCDIDGIRLIVANNVSVMGARGINYNQDKFNEKINLNYLEEISNDILMPFFYDTLRKLIISLIKTESGQPLIEQKVIDEFDKISKITDQWDSLKKLVTLPLC